MHLVLDSTGLELFGQGEWDAEKHGRARRQWRKLHLAVDADMGEIASQMLTDGHADDAAQVPALLGQAGGVIGSVTADGALRRRAYVRRRSGTERHPTMEVVVPPRASAVPSLNDNDGGTQSQRDRHIQLKAEGDRMRQAQSGRNSHVQV